jgi:hypothetical protein
MKHAGCTPHASLRFFDAACGAQPTGFIEKKRPVEYTSTDEVFMSFVPDKNCIRRPGAGDFQQQKRKMGVL